MKRLILIRGMLGSGKSTMAVNEYNERVHFEADMYFALINNGNYIYDSCKVKDAHEWCQRKTLAALEAGKYVVVSNTFTRVCEMQPYFNMGYSFGVITVSGDYGSVHNVPSETIRKMRERFEPYSC